MKKAPDNPEQLGATSQRGHRSTSRPGSKSHPRESVDPHRPAADVEIISNRPPQRTIPRGHYQPHCGTDNFDEFANYDAMRLNPQMQVSARAGSFDDELSQRVDNDRNELPKGAKTYNIRKPQPDLNCLPSTVKTTANDMEVEEEWDEQGFYPNGKSSAISPPAPSRELPVIDSYSRNKPREVKEASQMPDTTPAHVSRQDLRHTGGAPPGHSHNTRSKSRAGRQMEEQEQMATETYIGDDLLKKPPTGRDNPQLSISPEPRNRDTKSQTLFGNGAGAGRNKEAPRPVRISQPKVHESLKPTSTRDHSTVPVNNIKHNNEYVAGVTGGGGAARPSYPRLPDSRDPKCRKSPMLAPGPDLRTGPGDATVPNTMETCEAKRPKLDGQRSSQSIHNTLPVDMPENRSPSKLRSADLDLEYEQQKSIEPIEQGEYRNVETNSKNPCSVLENKSTLDSSHIDDPCESRLTEAGSEYCDLATSLLNNIQSSSSSIAKGIPVAPASQNKHLLEVRKSDQEEGSACSQNRKSPEPGVTDDTFLAHVQSISKIVVHEEEGASVPVSGALLDENTDGFTEQGTAAASNNVDLKNVEADASHEITRVVPPEVEVARFENAVSGAPLDENTDGFTEEGTAAASNNVDLKNVEADASQEITRVVPPEVEVARFENAVSGAPLDENTDGFTEKGTAAASNHVDLKNVEGEASQEITRVDSPVVEVTRFENAVSGALLDENTDGFTEEETDAVFKNMDLKNLEGEASQEITRVEFPEELRAQSERNENVETSCVAEVMSPDVPNIIPPASMPDTKVASPSLRAENLVVSSPVRSVTGSTFVDARLSEPIDPSFAQDTKGIPNDEEEREQILVNGLLNTEQENGMQPRSAYDLEGGAYPAVLTACPETVVSGGEILEIPGPPPSRCSTLALQGGDKRRGRENNGRGLEDCRHDSRYKSELEEKDKRARDQKKEEERLKAENDRLLKEKKEREWIAKQEEDRLRELERAREEEARRERQMAREREERDRMVQTICGLLEGGHLKKVLECYKNELIEHVESGSIPLYHIEKCLENLGNDVERDGIVLQYFYKFHKAHQLSELFMESIARWAETVLSHSEFKKLCFEEVKEILSMDTLCAHEITVLRAAMTWLREPVKNWDSRTHHRKDVMGLIRFGSMSLFDVHLEPLVSGGKDLEKIVKIILTDNTGTPRWSSLDTIPLSLDEGASPVFCSQPQRGSFELHFSVDRPVKFASFFIYNTLSNSTGIHPKTLEINWSLYRGIDRVSGPFNNIECVTDNCERPAIASGNLAVKLEPGKEYSLVASFSLAVKCFECHPDVFVLSDDRYATPDVKLDIQKAFYGYRENYTKAYKSKLNVTPFSKLFFLSCV